MTIDDFPKYSRTEFERRWLVNTSVRPAMESSHAIFIRDRYIVGTRLRLRQMDRPDLGECQFKLAKKYEADDPSARPITDFYLTSNEHDTLRALPAAEVVKQRFHFLHQDRWWSLEVFEDALAGIEIVECEADSAEALKSLEPPAWVLREVTDLAQWQCGALAAHGIPED